MFRTYVACEKWVAMGRQNRPHSLLPLESVDSRPAAGLMKGRSRCKTHVTLNWLTGSILFLNHLCPHYCCPVDCGGFNTHLAPATQYTTREQWHGRVRNNLNNKWNIKDRLASWTSLRTVLYGLQINQLKPAGVNHNDHRLQNMRKIISYLRLFERSS